MSLHIAETNVDSGAIIAQKVIPYDWEDTGYTLYKKAKKAMFQLFTRTYPDIKKNNFTFKKQDLSKGSFHLAKEINSASYINLEKNYSARDLLNLMRARTFRGYPGCTFEENGKKYEIRIIIKRKKKMTTYSKFKEESLKK